MCVCVCVCLLEKPNGTVLYDTETGHIYWSTCSADPLKVALEGLGKVFSHAKLSERLAPLYPGSLVTELSEIFEREKCKSAGIDVQGWIYKRL